MKEWAGRTLNLAGAVAGASVVDVARAFAAPVIGALVTSGLGAGPVPGAIAGGGFSALLYVGRQVSIELGRRRAAVEEVERGHQEMRRIAELAFDTLLDVELWIDVLELNAHAMLTQPPRRVRRHVWSVTAILGRGRDVLVDAQIGLDGWRALASGLRGQSAELTTLVAQELPGPAVTSRDELKAIYAGAAAGAEACAGVISTLEGRDYLFWAIESAERDAARSTLRAQRAAAFDTLEDLARRIVALDSSGAVRQKLAEAESRHAGAYDAEITRERGLQELAATAAEQLLVDAAPAPAYLVRALRDGTLLTLRDIADDPAFGFAPEDEDAALAVWRSRIARAYTAAVQTVEGRGFEMHERTQRLFVDALNEGTRELDNAIVDLEGDLRAQRGTDGAGHSEEFAAQVRQNVERSREKVRDAVRKLVGRVEALHAVTIPDGTEA